MNNFGFGHQAAVVFGIDGGVEAGIVDCGKLTTG